MRLILHIMRLIQANAWKSEFDKIPIFTKNKMHKKSELKWE